MMVRFLDRRPGSAHRLRQCGQLGRSHAPPAARRNPACSAPRAAASRASFSPNRSSCSCSADWQACSSCRGGMSWVDFLFDSRSRPRIPGQLRSCPTGLGDAQLYRGHRRSLRNHLRVRPRAATLNRNELHVEREFRRSSSSGRRGSRYAVNFCPRRDCRRGCRFDFHGTSSAKLRSHGDGRSQLSPCQSDHRAARIAERQVRERRLKIRAFYDQNPSSACALCRRSSPLPSRRWFRSRRRGEFAKVSRADRPPRRRTTRSTLSIPG